MRQLPGPARAHANACPRKREARQATKAGGREAREIEMEGGYASASDKASEVESKGLDARYR